MLRALAGRGSITRARIAALVAVVVVTAGSPAVADDAPEDPARVAFREGARLIEQAEWARALGAFERSYAAKPHALTLYNIGVCQRYIGSYTLARQTLEKALARHGATNEMPELFVDQAKTYISEMDSKLARLVVSLAPRHARVAVEGRPVVPAPGKEGVYVAGVAEAASPGSLDRDRFEVLVDPRPVVLTFSLEGYDTIEVRRDPKPGSSEQIDVSMAQQPAQIRVASNVTNAIVRVDGVDVGIAPVVVSRPPGVRLVSVASDGYVPYESKITLRPGQTVPLDARLSPEKPPITKKWWFWAGAAATVAAAGVITYFVVRPEPTRPAPDGGKLGWVADVK
jgi:hypothetical protein